MKVIVDAMGGDNAPGAIVHGCVLGMEENEKLNITLVGKQGEIEAELSKYKYDQARVSIVNATETIEMDETPVDAIRKRRIALWWWR